MSAFLDARRVLTHATLKGGRIVELVLGRYYASRQVDKWVEVDLIAVSQAGFFDIRSEATPRNPMIRDSAADLGLHGDPHENPATSWTLLGRVSEFLRVWAGSES